MDQGSVCVDIAGKQELVAIILTKTSSREIFEMTQECISTLRANADADSFVVKVALVESERSLAFSYSGVDKLIVPDEDFGFHRFLNLGMNSMPDANWYALCNNDLLFAPGWLREIERVVNDCPTIASFSPISPTCADQAQYLNERRSFVLGYHRRRELAGWCIVVKSEVLKLIGGLDERFGFYFADDDYALSLRRNNIRHALVTRSFVEHLEDRKVFNVILDFSAPVKAVPKILLKKRYQWISASDEMVQGFLVFTRKWGDIRVVAAKRKIHDLFFLRLGVGIFSKLMFRAKGP